MGELNQSEAITIIELAKRILGTKVLPLVNPLVERNDLLKVALWVQSNKPTSHITSIVKSLPTGTRSKINIGIPYEAGQVGQEEEAMEGLECLSKVDRRLLQGIDNPKAFRQGEDSIVLEGLFQTLLGDIFYGNAATDPTQISGLATRLNSTALDNVIDAGGSGGDTTSIFVIGFSDKKCHFIHPQKSKPALAVEDLGLQLVTDGEATPHDFPAYVSYLGINAGLCINDSRYVYRIANIETSGSTNLFDPNDLVDALGSLPELNGAFILMNGTLLKAMDKNAMDKTNVTYSPEEPYGEPITRFRGVQIVRCDAIINTETVVGA